ncbi:MAG: hypothetical protein HOV67_30855 [Kribbellaceae bacterium]|nr:hypothetical protein [Catenulispora sp.]NUR99645.1 hypothetical protein [Kribbellaceae bacterium]
MLALTGLVVALMVGTTAPASAHPTLLSTTPEAGYSVPTAPARISLVFDEPVTVAPTGVHLGQSGRRTAHRRNRWPPACSVCPRRLQRPSTPAIRRPSTDPSSGSGRWPARSR